MIWMNQWIRKITSIWRGDFLILRMSQANESVHIIFPERKSESPLEVFFRVTHVRLRYRRHHHLLHARCERDLRVTGGMCTLRERRNLPPQYMLRWDGFPWEEFLMKGKCVHWNTSEENTRRVSSQSESPLTGFWSHESMHQKISSTHHIWHFVLMEIRAYTRDVMHV